MVSRSSKDFDAREALLSISEKEQDPRPSRNRGRNLLLLLIPTSVFALVTGIIIGALLPKFHSRRATDLPHPPGAVHQIWQHNLSYSQKPTPESEEAWNSIIPLGRGFIHHERLAPFISNIAVFHQLHCLVRLPPMFLFQASMIFP